MSGLLVPQSSIWTTPWGGRPMGPGMFKGWVPISSRLTNLGFKEQKQKRFQ